MIQITEDKMEGLSENIKMGLRYLGKAMQCVEELGGGKYGERDYDDDDDDDYGMRDYGMRYGRRYREGGYGMRQGVKGTGPYSRYR